jgi:ElaB/YqjD/DUF883 family membrane-anchored ribosome-binding protein
VVNQPEPGKKKKNVATKERAVVDDKRESARGGRDGHAHKNRIFEHTADLKEEAQDIASSLSELTRDLTDTVSVHLQQRPYAVLGVAAAVGYVLGGGLASRITRAGLGLGARIGMGMLVRQFVEQQGAFGAGVAGRGDEDVEGMEGGA